jgi:hypothetical protein
MKFLLPISVIIFLFISCSKEPEYIEYTYEVSGTGGSYDVTLQNSDDNTSQYSNVGNGWWYKWKQTGTRWLYFSAQNNNSAGTVIVKIYKAGKVISSNTSEGGYVVATVSGNY